MKNAVCIDHLDLSREPRYRQDFERDYVAASRPVVIRRAMDGWPALARWAHLEAFATAFRGTELEVECFPEPLCEPTARRFVRMGFDTFRTDSDADRADRRLHLIGSLTDGSEAVNPLTRLMPDVRFPWFLDPRRHTTGVLFLGKDTVTQCHYHHREHALFCQVLGVKRVLLFPPAQTRNLYPRTWCGRWFNRSGLNLDARGQNPDPPRFPRFDASRPLIAVLRPGEMLFVPVYWWHAVFGSDWTASVTHFWRAQRRQRLFCRLAPRGNHLRQRGPAIRSAPGPRSGER